MVKNWTVIGLGVSVILATGLIVVRDSPFRAWADAAQLDPAAARSATFAVDCSAQAQPISPHIYGLGGHLEKWSAGVSARRHGGNPTSRWNWELDTYNTANDWFFRNAGGANPGAGLDGFIDENLKHGASTTLTVPMIGWVAKDNSSYSFPVSVFGKQKAVAPEEPNMGNGVALDGSLIPPGPPTVTSAPSTPESIEKWIRRTRERDKDGGRSVDSYILDNEPMLWNTTHRDVHPEPVTYDELLEKTIAYASAIRRADPGAKIAGPAEWGWQAYHYSAKDIVLGKLLRTDRRAHGDVPLIPWYLRKLREHEKKTGVKLLDILDVHFYPMADGVHAGKTDAFTNARRLRSTRSLWDPTYKDESWIDERMQVLPLLKQWINENYPGLRLSIGEWNFGAGTHMSGGLATAEVLGRFADAGVYSAYIWDGPHEKTATFWAFRAYRNFDGHGARFQDWLMPVKAEGTFTSLYASRDEKREKLVAVLLNMSPLSRLTARLTLQGCGAVSGSRGFTYAGGEEGFTTLPVESTADGLSVVVAPYTITVIDLTAGTTKP